MGSMSTGAPGYPAPPDRGAAVSDPGTSPNGHWSRDLSADTEALMWDLQWYTSVLGPVWASATAGGLLGGRDRFLWEAVENDCTGFAVMAAEALLMGEEPPEWFTFTTPAIELVTPVRDGRDHAHWVEAFTAYAAAVFAVNGTRLAAVQERISLATRIENDLVWPDFITAFNERAVLLPPEPPRRHFNVTTADGTGFLPVGAYDTMEWTALWAWLEDLTEADLADPVEALRHVFNACLPNTMFDSVWANNAAHRDGVPVLLHVLARHRDGRWGITELDTIDFATSRGWTSVPVFDRRQRLWFAAAALSDPARVGDAVKVAQFAINGIEDGPVARKDTQIEPMLAHMARSLPTEQQEGFRLVLAMGHGLDVRPNAT